VGRRARRGSLALVALGVATLASVRPALAQDALLPENAGAQVNRNTAPLDPAAPTPPAPAPAPPAAPGAAASKLPPPPPPPRTRPLLKKDELDPAGYVPGYRRYEGLGLSPYAPRQGAYPGGMTPAFNAPAPTDDFTFTFSGYMSATLQASINHRIDEQSGQKRMVLHAPPSVVEEYAAFPSTNSLPGNWIGANFSYGNEFVTATVSIDSWNPSAPSQYPQGQWFLNNMFLKFRAPPLGKFRLGFTVGFFTSTYGALGRYGGGFYTNPIAGWVQGAGETTVAEYDLSDRVTLVAEQGIHNTGGPRVGFMPAYMVKGIGNGGDGGDPSWPSAFVHHLHFGVIQKGDIQLQTEVHYLTNWAQDDRVQRKQGTTIEDPCDLQTTQELNECYVRDGRIRVYAADAKMTSRAYGVLGIGAAYITGHYADTLKGLITFGGDGERLTSSWWGLTTQGTGKLWIAGISYSMSVASFMLNPEPFDGQGPDIQIDAGFNIGTSTSNEPAFDRTRYKYGAKVTYTFLPFMGAGIRADQVVPSSIDPDQTFTVLAPWIQFKSGWTSHETISLSYVKWFLGAHTHLDGMNPRYAYGKIDDQMVALNFNMWW